MHCKVMAELWHHVAAEMEAAENREYLLLVRFLLGGGGGCHHHLHLHLTAGHRATGLLRVSDFGRVVPFTNIWKYL